MLYCLNCFFKSLNIKSKYINAVSLIFLNKKITTIEIKVVFFNLCFKIINIEIRVHVVYLPFTLVCFYHFI